MDHDDHIDLDAPQPGMRSTISDTVIDGVRVPLITIAGELDGATSPRLRAAVVDLMPTVPPEGLAIDVRDLTFVDSAGLATLLMARKLLDGRRLRLVGATGQVRDTLSLTSIDVLFELVDEPLAS